MKRRRLYYLTDTIESTESTWRDLHSVGVGYDNFHVLSKDEDGLKRHDIHSASPLETYDIVHSGERGLLLGVVFGVLFGIALLMVEPFDMDLGLAAFMVVLIAGASFGTWLGGMIGLAHRNYRVEPFAKEIDAGKYLLMVDVNEMQEPVVRELMMRLHGEAHLEGDSPTASNPFDGLPVLRSWQSR